MSRTNRQEAPASWALWGPQAAVTALLLVLLAAVAFDPCLQNNFVNWDDEANFLENPYYRGLGWAQLRWDWTSFHVGVYQPLAWMILGAQYVLFGLKPWGYHLTSLILHAVNTVVLFVLTVSLLERGQSGREREHPRLLVLAAGLAVGLFAVHPLRTEVVAWASCQPYLLSALFWMLAVLAYLHALRGGETPEWGWMVASFAFFAAALLCKAVAVTLPAVLLILDIYPLRRLGDGPGRWVGSSVRKVWYEKIPFGALSLAFIGLAVVGRIETQGAGFLRKPDLPTRLLQSCYGIWFYLVKTVLPTDLRALYPVPDRLVPFEAPFVSCIFGTLWVSVALFFLRRRWPGVLAAWLSYLVILAPNLGLIWNGPQIAADRYTYISMIGPVVLVAAGFFRLSLARPGGTFAAVGLTAASLAALVGLIRLSQGQCQTWRTTENLWTHVLTHGGGRSDIAHYNLGVNLYDQGRIDEAGAHYEQALRLNPRYPEAHCNLGLIRARERRFDEARLHYEESLRLYPSYPGAHINLGLLLAGQGRFDEARDHYEQALRLNPNLAVAHSNLGLTLKAQGRIDEARAQFDQALRINPNSALTYNERAWLEATAALAKYRDGPRAVEDATRACALSGWKNAGFLATLAAAHAESGNFETAVQWQTRALELLTGETQKADFRSRLRLYQARQPYHEPIGAR